MCAVRAAAELAYLYEGRVYLNVTNRCPTACRFCAKFQWDFDYRGYSLRLDHEPSAEELAAAALERLPAAGPCEAVFCGYGEPTERLAVVLETARLLRAARPGIRLRLNTVGLGSLSSGRDIVPELARAVDEVSVSLNTADPAQWRHLHRPRAGLAQDGFAAVCAFIRACVRAGIKTTATAVDQPGVDLVAVEGLARSFGARFRLRPGLVES